MKETVLLFGFEQHPGLLELESALFPLGIQLKYIDKKDYLTPLRVLAELEQNTFPLSYDGASLSTPMIIFAFFDDEKLDMALAALRNCSTPFTPYKAILTPTNKNWNVLACFEEIKKEHEEMSRRSN